MPFRDTKGKWVNGHYHVGFLCSKKKLSSYTFHGPMLHFRLPKEKKRTNWAFAKDKHQSILPRKTQ